MKARIAAVFLLTPLALAAVGPGPALADPLERSLRPLSNPLLGTQDVAREDGIVPAAPMPLIGPAWPAATLVAKVPAPPVNPKLGVITLSTSNRVTAPDPDLPLIGAMLPASMPEPEAATGAATGAALLPAAVAPAAGDMADVLAVPVATPSAPSLRPRARPETIVKPAPVPEIAAEAATVTTPALLLTSLRPKQKPARIIQLASAPAPAVMPVPEAAPQKEKGRKASKAPASTKGSVCGVAAIKGEPIAPITSKVQGCGLSDGVRVTSVSGVRLSMAATIDCSTAKALNTWVERVAQPAYDNQITELQLAGHYTCRPRNNKKGAKVSEHGRGKALDIAGIRLASGKVLRVLGGFDQTMRKAYKGACGIFGTTLGPGSDGYHEDHMHFDTANHRSGAYCR